MTVSIVIPVYNRGYFLPECIASVICQTFTDWECIIVDDGSTDNTWEICQDYAQKDPRIKIFHQENSGVSAARNLGLRYASGHYVCFLDSDDFLDANCLSKLYDAIVDHDMSIAGVRITGTKGDNISFAAPAKTIWLNADNEQDFADLYDSGLLLGPVSKLYKKEIIDRHNILFPLGVCYGEDTIFVSTYLSHINKLRVIPDLMYNVVSTPNSLSEAPFQKYPYAIYLNIWSSWRDFYQAKCMCGDVSRAKLNGQYYLAIWLGVSYIACTRDNLSILNRIRMVRDIYKSLDTERMKGEVDLPTLRRLAIRCSFSASMMMFYRYIIFRSTHK